MKVHNMGPLIFLDSVRIKSVFLLVLFLLQKYFAESTLLHRLHQSRTMTVRYPQVEISTGTLRGSFGTSREGREFYQFLGIPYGQPPTGLARFEMPVPAKKWQGVRRAEKHRPPCLQLNWITGLISGQEDCLYLNVYVPNTGGSEASPNYYELQRSVPEVDSNSASEEEEEGGQKKEDEGEEWDVKEIAVDLRRGNTTHGEGDLLPVIVFIYGGYYHYGSSRVYGPQYIMDQNIILVSFDYRVGALGFLNTGTNGLIRGNMGLKDQTMALRWVQANIRQFGGDPNKVTLVGESAGGSSVHYHMLSKMSSGLFHKAISQSGTAIRTWQLTYRPAEQAKRLAQRLNCTTASSFEMVKCLKNVDGAQIVSTHHERFSVLSNPLAQFAPSLETVKDDGTFMTRHPLEVLKSGDFSHVPWLLGINSEEGLIYSARITRNKNVVSRINSDWENVAPILLNYNGNRTEVASLVKNFYLKNDKLSSSVVDFRENFNNFTNMFTDRLYGAATRLAAMEHSKYAKTFMYYFSYKGQFTFYNIFLSAGTFPRVLELGYSVATNWVRNHVFRRRRPKLGVCHADELAMLFSLSYLTKVRKYDVDFEMSKSMVAAWANFAIDDQNLQFQNHEWLPIDAKDDSPRYMNLDSNNGGLIREPYTAEK